jgi:hypothetical protein
MKRCLISIFLVVFKQKHFHNFGRTYLVFFPVNDNNFRDCEGTLRVANMNSHINSIAVLASTELLQITWRCAEQNKVHPSQ